MTIDEAIKHVRQVAKYKRADADWKWTHGRLNSDDCISCAEEHEQLAKWLEELKRLRQETEQDIYERAYAEGREKGYSCGEFNGYNKAIDDFVDKVYFMLGSEDSDIYCKETVNEIAEQLKAKK